MDTLYSVDSIKHTLNPVFREHGVRSAVLFGSYAKGRATSRSDVDIMVDSGLKGLAFYGLLEDVASSLLIPVDLIDASQIEHGSEIEKEIMKTGVTIYGQ